MHFSVRFLALVLVLAALAGCASQRGQLTLDPVGPPKLTRSTEHGIGHLQVMTQREYRTSGGIEFFNYTAYLVYDLQGRKVKTVQNHAGPTDQRAMIVDLPAGRYQVLARAQGYGLVTVPVVIAAETLTEVSLSGEGLQAAKAAGDAEVVRLPGGPIVGWRVQLPRTTPATAK